MPLAEQQKGPSSAGLTSMDYEQLSFSSDEEEEADDELMSEAEKLGGASEEDIEEDEDTEEDVVFLGTTKLRQQRGKRKPLPEVLILTFLTQGQWNNCVRLIREGVRIEKTRRNKEKRRVEKTRRVEKKKGRRDVFRSISCSSEDRNALDAWMFKETNGCEWGELPKKQFPSSGAIQMRISRMRKLSTWPEIEANLRRYMSSSNSAKSPGTRGHRGATI